MDEQNKKLKKEYEQKLKNLNYQIEKDIQERSILLEKSLNMSTSQISLID